MSYNSDYYEYEQMGYTAETVAAISPVLVERAVEMEKSLAEKAGVSYSEYLSSYGSPRLIEAVITESIEAAGLGSPLVSTHLYTEAAIVPVSVVTTALGTVVTVLISQIPLIITILKGLGYLAVAEEIYELITGTTGLTSVDDVVQAWIAQRMGTAPGLPGGPDAGLAIGKSGDPTDYKVGQVREGWEIQKKTKYDYGKEYQVNCWYKPFDDPSRSKVGARMNFREKCGYYQGMRVQTVTGREAKYRAYRRGFDDGAREQQEAERSQEGGTTGLVRYSRSRRTRNRR